MRGPHAASVACAFSCVLLAGTTQVPQPAPQPTFRSGIDVVQLDVSVLEKDRRPVRGLTAGDFTILENGTPQPIVAFAAVDVPESVEAAAAWMREFAPDVVSNEPETRRLVVIVLDDAHMPYDPAAATIAKQVARSAIDQLGPTDLAAVVFTFVGRNQNFTSDRARLLAAIDSLVPHPASLGCALRAGGGCAIETLSRVARVLRTAPSGRKAVIYVSSGAPVGISPAAASANDIDDMFSKLVYVRDLFRNLQEANVTLYAFDPSGLQTGVSTAADRRPARSSLPVNESLRAFAESTGGRAFTDTNDPWQYVAEAFRETRSYYLLGFQSTNIPANDRFRRVQVKVNRSGVQVRTRSGYFAPKKAVTNAPVSSAPTALDDAMASGLPRSDMPMRISVSAFAVPGRRDAEVIAVVGVRPGAGSKRQVELTATAFDTNWRPHGTHRQRVELTLKPDSREDLQYDVTLRFPLRAGRYEIRFGAESGGRIGSMFVDLDVPDFSHNQLSLSGLLLGRTPSAGGAETSVSDVLPIVPTTLREFGPLDRVTALLRIYQGGRRPPMPCDVTSRIVNDRNQTVFERTIRLDPGKFATTRGVDHRVELPVADLPAGQYLLTIEAARGTQLARRHSRFTVR